MKLILGIGIDLCRIARIRRSVDRLGEAWIEELFTAEEQTYCTGALDRGLAFACGFACKEACAKALGSGFADGVHPLDIVVTHDNGMWGVKVDGLTRKRLRTITPTGYTSSFRVVISTVETFVSCLVIIDAVQMCRGPQGHREVIGHAYRPASSAGEVYSYERPSKGDFDPR
jgi:holo-[acyl-carrier protein] synthase